MQQPCSLLGLWNIFRPPSGLTCSLIGVPSKKI
jgi:hypothetical protein